MAENRNLRTSILGNQRGVTYMVVLVMVVVLGLTAGIAGSSWQTIVQRSKEKELLFRGNQYREAIGSYYRHAHAGAPSLFPRDLEDLLKDPRSLETVRHIRKLYPDPMTGEEWELIREGGKIDGTVSASASAGRIIGVRSTSDLKPFQKDGFSKVNEKFADAKSYRDWEFIYRPEKKQASAPPGAQPPGPTSQGGASPAQPPNAGAPSGNSNGPSGTSANP